MEKALYRRLVEAFPGHLVLPQVAFSQLIKNKRGAPAGTRGRYSQCVADFVICDSEFKSLAVVELDGKAHDSAARQLKDRNKDQAAVAAGLQVHRISSKTMPTSAQIRALVLSGQKPQSAAA
jgi:very-short-patch-repair endonuclease